MLPASMAAILALFLLYQIQDVAGAQSCDSFTATRPINVTGSTYTKRWKLLIDLSACLETHTTDPNGFYFTDSEKMTGLMLAAKAGFKGIVQNLVHHPNIDVNVQDNEYGYTAAIFAAEKGHAKILNLLIDLGANIEHQVKNGNTALILAARFGRLNVVRSLLKRGALVNRHGSKYHTALIHAASNKHEAVVHVLLQNDADVDATNDEGWTALHYAASKGYFHIARALLRKGADVNAVTNAGWSPLGYAVVHGNIATVRVVLNGKPNMNYTIGSSNALEWALRMAKCDIARLLMSHSAVFTHSWDKEKYEKKC